VKRLAASFEVAGRERGFDDATRDTAVRATVRSYREAMANFAAMRHRRRSPQCSSHFWVRASSRREGGAWSRARAHARSGDAIAISSYLGKGDAFDRAMASFAMWYADQNEQDYKALQAAEKSGRITAHMGV
jgi:hypothetical protein